jgi:two-component system, OmpR family, phosphate regulon response regulator PhoB
MATVLIAEDDADVRDVVAFLLEKAGYTVRTVDSGPGALTEAGAGDVDLAVLDVWMPEMTGLQVCERLRADPATAHLPVILMTASADDPGTADQLAAAEVTCLAKPFSSRELIRRVRTCLSRRHCPR